MPCCPVGYTEYVSIFKCKLSLLKHTVCTETSYLNVTLCRLHSLRLSRCPQATHGHQVGAGAAAEGGCGGGGGAVGRGIVGEDAGTLWIIQNAEYDEIESLNLYAGHVPGAGGAVRAGEGHHAHGQGARARVFQPWAALIDEEAGVSLRKGIRAA